MPAKKNSLPETTDNRPEINYPLVEDTRPPMYRAVKYWGKKPHNIWSQYIERYCPPNGIVLDPFVGSGVAAFEAAKIGRNAYAFDLNPLSSFIIDVLSTPFDELQFITRFNQIAASVEKDQVAKQN
ncbi:MAG TPA: DNA methyltransferase [Verrucomicrobiae bacterium]|jgi:16S rRNA G966 N2-methylase RsmD